MTATLNSRPVNMALPTNEENTTPIPAANTLTPTYFNDDEEEGRLGTSIAIYGDDHHHQRRGVDMKNSSTSPGVKEDDGVTISNDITPPPLCTTPPTGGKGGGGGRGFTLPLWLLFVLQSVVVCGAFIAVILVLVLQQQDQITTSVFDEISLRQERSRYAILSPLVAREERFKSLEREIRNRPDMWYEETMNQSSDAVRRFHNYSYYLFSDDPLVYICFQHAGHSTVTAPDGSRMFAIAAMVNGPSSSLVTLTPAWNVAETNPANLHFGFPLSYDTPLTYHVPITNLTWSLIMRKQTNTGWGRGGVAYNTLQNSFTVVAGLQIPLVFNETTQETTLTFVYGFNVSYIAESADSALLSPTSKLLIYDGVSDLIMSSRNTGQPDFDEANFDVWNLDTFPDTSLVARYRQFVAAGSLEATTSNDSSWVAEEQGDDIVSMLYLATEYGYRAQIFQITPRSFYFAASEKSMAIGIAIGVVAAVLVLVSCVLIWLSVQGPIHRLRESMELAAVMRNDEVSDTSSVLTELNLLSQSFIQMNDKLLQARAFMPQSMLYGSEQSDEGEEEEATVSVTQEISALENSNIQTSNSCSTVTSSIATTTQRKASLDSNGNVPKAAVDVRNRDTPVVGRLVAGLVHKKVGVLIINARGTHKLASSGGATLLEREQVRLVELVEKSARAEKGVVDAFQGDHFVLTFNAVRTVGTPGRNAAQVSLSIEEGAQRDGLTLQSFSMGLSVGRAYIGNVGSATMKKNCTIGSVYTQAVGLEVLANVSERTCVFSGRSLGEVELVAYCQLLGNLTTRLRRNSTGSPSPDQLYSAARRIDKGDSSEEWLYQLEEAATVNPYKTYNQALTHYLDGDVVSCTTSLDMLLNSPAATTTLDTTLVSDATTLRRLVSSQECGEICPPLVSHTYNFTL